MERSTEATDVLNQILTCFEGETEPPYAIMLPLRETSFETREANDSMP
jgi:hypothetical protein